MKVMFSGEAHSSHVKGPGSNPKHHKAKQPTKKYTCSPQAWLTSKSLHCIQLVAHILKHARKAKQQDSRYNPEAQKPRGGNPMCTYVCKAEPTLSRTSFFPVSVLNYCNQSSSCALGCGVSRDEERRSSEAQVIISASACQDAGSGHVPSAGLASPWSPKQSSEMAQS